MSKELITTNDAQDELDDLERDLDANSTDYKEINDKAQRLLEWLRCVLDTGWVWNKIPDNLNEEAMRMRGANDGRQASPQPSANETEPSQIEQDVVNHYRDLESRRVYVETIANGIINCAIKAVSTIKAISTTEAINNMKARRENLGNRARETVVEARLENYQKNFREKLQYLKDFRSAHNLNRPVKYEPNTLKFFSTLLLYLVIGTFVNGFLYSKVTASFLEGWSIAFIIAMLVIALGAGAGKFGTRLRGLAQHVTYKGGLGEVSADDLYRQGWHTADKEYWYKWERHSLLYMLFWGIVTLSFVIAGLVVVAFAYIYRDVAEYLLSSGVLNNLTSPEVIIVVTMERLGYLALEPQSGLSAITLIVVDGLMFIISFYKFHFQRDDCIPGYVEASLNLKYARERYREEISKIDPSAAWKSADRSIIELGTFVNSIREGTNALKDILPILSNEYTRACRNILESYREANKATRPEIDKEGPAYFKKFPMFEPLSMDKFEEEHERLCATIEGVDIINIARDVKDWENKFIEGHRIEVEKYKE